MNMSEEQLRAICREEINRVLVDLELTMPYPLAAEPINETQASSQLIKALSKASPQERQKVCNHFGFYSRNALGSQITKNVLRNISNINLAQKGSFEG
tara:strand:+ start:1082 stop:1375 length:294 start_codon:yes stop_codon:yes gene_type:complete